MPYAEMDRKRRVRLPDGFVGEGFLCFYMHGEPHLTYVPELEWEQREPSATEAERRMFYRISRQVRVGEDKRLRMPSDMARYAGLNGRVQLLETGAGTLQIFPADGEND